MAAEHRRDEAADAGSYDALVATAGNLFAAHDYDQVVLLLEEIPKDQRSAAAKRLLRQATQLADEVADLKVRIDDMVGRERFAGLKEALERLVEIRPGLKRYEGYLQAINTYRHGAAYKVHRAPGGSVRFDPAGSEWTAGTIALLVLVPLLIFGGLYFAVRAYLADDAALTAVVLEIDDPTVEVAIDDRTLAADEIGVPVQMTVGEHDLSVRRDGRSIHGQRFRITEGNRTVLRIRVKDDVTAESPPETVASTPAPPTSVTPPPRVEPPKSAPPVVEPPKVAPPPKPAPPAVPLQPDPGAPAWTATGIDADGKIVFRALGRPGSPTVDGKYVAIPAAFPPGAHDADRAAAEWFLAGKKGEVVLYGSDGLLHFRRNDGKQPIAPLPTSPFVVLRMKFDEGIEGAECTRLGGLANLSELRLSFPPNDDCRGLQSLQASVGLRSLHVGNGLISNATAGALRNFAELRELAVSHCERFDIETYRTVGGLRSLEALRLGTAVTCRDAEATELGRLANLKVLSIHEGKFGEPGAAAIGMLRGLEKLELTWCRMGFPAAAMAHFATLPNLRSLSLYNTPTDDDDLAEIGRMANLVDLHLAGGRYTDAGFAALGGCTKLESLRAEGDAGLTDAVVPHLLRMPSLTRLFLGRSQFTKDGAQALRTARPSLKATVLGF